MVEEYTGGLLYTIQIGHEQNSLTAMRCSITVFKRILQHPKAILILGYYSIFHLLLLHSVFSVVTALAV